jgi:uncharacterized protein DUF6789
MKTVTFGDAGGVSAGKAIVGGVVATATMTLMMYVLAPMILGGPMDIAGMLGAMLGGSWGLGMAMHVLNGALIFPLIYAFVLSRVLPGEAWLKGTLWGAILWLVAQTVVMPVMGAGLFSAHAGGPMAAVASLMGHLVYGALLGAIGGTAEERQTLACAAPVR